MNRMNPFRIDLPLSAGAMLVEASAGTGKTWSIARLVARLLAEDPAQGGSAPTIDQILVVTYTRAATAELRDRVRRVLVDATAALTCVRLASNLGLPSDPPRDPAFACLAGVSTPAGWKPLPADVLDRHIARLRNGARDFDTASIFTIHGWCQRVLTTLAFESESSFDGELLNDDTELRESIVDDWMDRTLVPADDLVYNWIVGGVGLNRARLLDIARTVVSARGGARVLPDGVVDWRLHIRARAAAAQALGLRFAGSEGRALVVALGAAAAAGSLGKTWYGEAKIEASYAEFVQWLATGAPPAAGEPASGPFRVFQQAFVTEKTNRNGVPFQHALLSAVDAWVATFDATVCDAPIVEFAAFALQEHVDRLRRSQSLTFDDLLLSVHARLDRPELVSGLRRRFRVALIDEFQDTDAAQWDIFRAVFLENPRGCLILIGDPKQAIYAFRGADVSVYAHARSMIPADRQYTMTRNFRTDGPALDALESLFQEDPNIFVTGEITFGSVQAQHAESRLNDAAGSSVAPLVVRWFDSAIVRGVPDGTLSNGAADAALPAVVALDVRTELARGWMRRHEDGVVRPLRARDIAVLTFTNRTAAGVQQALLAAGIPAIISQAGSVFATEEALWLERWLTALAEPGRDSPARAVAITPLFGWGAPELLFHGDEEARASAWVAFMERLEAHAALLEVGVVVAVAELLHGVSEPDGRTPLARVASLPDGERRLTNLRHLTELLHEAALTERLGSAGLRMWLKDRRRRNDAESDTAELRLESDADTVQVVTVHKSKGLEYPIVLAPFLWDGRLLRGMNAASSPLRFHRAGEARLTVDLRGKRGAATADAATARREMLEERQRLLYVAVTRAQHRVVLYTGPTTGTGGQDLRCSPLGLLFHGRLGGGSRAANAEAAVPPLLKADPPALRRQVAALVAEKSGTLALENAGQGAGSEVPLPPAHAPPLPVCVPFARGVLDRDWRRESYSGLVGKRKGGVLEEALPEDTRDRDDSGEGARAGAEALTADRKVAGALKDPEDTVPVDVADVPMRAFPGGPEAGTWVHEVLEHASFVGATSDLAKLVRARGQKNGFPRADKDAVLINALGPIVRTPLGPAFGEQCLADVADGERLNELVFDMPIGPGDAWRDHRMVEGEELAALLGAERSDSPVSPQYLAYVRQMGFRRLCGFLTGTIDLVFRLHVGGRFRWFVADYKTNILGPRARGPDGDPSGRVLRSASGHYATPWMAGEIARKHYYIQYLLYVVALHRYLRMRLPAYTYDADMGGAAYLFLRGMVGPDTQRDARGVHGVFFDKPPESVIEGLSRLLARIDGGAP